MAWPQGRMQRLVLGQRVLGAPWERRALACSTFGSSFRARLFPDTLSFPFSVGRRVCSGL